MSFTSKINIKSDFENLFKKYYNDLCNFAFSYVKDREIAEEIVQDIFLNIWNNKNKLDIQISIKSYLYRAVRNHSLHYLEKQTVRRKYAETIDPNHPVTDFDSAEYADLMNIIDMALNTLSDKCRKIFELNRFDGLKYKEVAIVMDISVKTVEKCIGRALKILRQRLTVYKNE